MNDLWDQMSQVLHAIRLKRYLIVLFAWVCCFVGWGYVLQLPDQYKAEAQVYVDTSSLLKPLLKGLTIEVDSDQEVRLIAQTLKSRPNLEDVITSTDLSLYINYDKIDAEIRSLEQAIKIHADRRENLYNLEYSFEDPDVARQVVQKMLDIFVERTLIGTRTDNDSARQFIQEQIIEYEQRLQTADLKLTEFKRKNLGLLPEDGQGYYSALNKQRDLAEETELQLRETISQLNTAQNRLNQEPKYLGGTRQSNPLAIRIAQMEKNLDEMQLQYTDQHPDIRELKRRITDLKTQQSNVTNSSDVGDAVNSNPVYEQLKLAVAQLESTISSLQVRLQSYQEKVDQLEEKVYLIPQVEAELAELTRGYTIGLNKYEELLNRRDTAELAQRADTNAKDIQFKIIEPPLAPEYPSSPNRPLLLSMVTFIGLAGGIGIAFIISQLKPVISSPRDITESTGFPVLGSVSQISQITHDHRIIRHTAFVLGLMVIIIGYGLLLASLSDTPVTQVINQLLSRLF